MKNPVIRRSEILLPAPRVDMSKWATIAVDQYTSEPEYWRQVESMVGTAPSALRVTLPEVYLAADNSARTAAMQSAMSDYLSNGTLMPAVQSGYILVERTTQSGARLGIMAALDLEQYDFAANSRSLIRPTEGTVMERVPPRVAIRRGAQIELPHVLMLLNDPEQSAIEPIYARRAGLIKLYDFDLMQNGGHLRGWRVDGATADALDAAFDRLYAKCDGLFLAVGDGNHSLAAARAYWLELRETIPLAQRANHPARYALAEIVNLHSDVIQFEPIHRIVRNVNPIDIIATYEAHLRRGNLPSRAGSALKIVTHDAVVSYDFEGHPLRDLQLFLDDYIAVHPDAEIDYIHGDTALRRMAQEKRAVGFMPCAFAKGDLFPYIRAFGVLPRKTFSMGEANEKRFYCEARKL